MEVADLGTISELADLELGRAELNSDQMLVIAQQAFALLSGAYAHLPLKRIVHGIDPELDLRRLLDDLNFDFNSPSEDAFHERLTAVFASLRDLHTTYVLPSPHRRRVAFLPFLIERYDNHEGGFLVTKVWKDRAGGLEHGALVTHWNGIPIDRAVQLLAARRAGSNLEAERARAIEALTFRWLGKGGRPDEDRVTLTYVQDSAQSEVTYPWYVVERPSTRPATGGASGAARALGLDEESEWIREVKQALFARAMSRSERDPSDALPGVFRTRTVHGDVPYGYLRIFTFNVDDPRLFVREVRRIVAGLPQEGLIIDVRGNGGGHIVAAERLLQLFAEGPIEPVSLRFRNTPVTARIAESLEFAPTLSGTIRQQIVAGVPYSPATPLAPAAQYNDVGRTYQGHVVLLVDPLSYSATDIFAAGFADHQIGDILGTGSTTGAGGANVWDYETLRAYLQDDVEPAFPALPSEASFTVAVRQASRVKANSGTPLEHLGVESESTPPTRADILSGNRDLLQTAVRRLDLLREVASDETSQTDREIDRLGEAAVAGSTSAGYRLLQKIDDSVRESGNYYMGVHFLTALVGLANAEAVAMFVHDQPNAAARVVEAVRLQNRNQPYEQPTGPMVEGAMHMLRVVADTAWRRKGQQPLARSAARVLFRMAAKNRRLIERMDTRFWLDQLEPDGAKLIAECLTKQPKAVRWYVEDGWEPRPEAPEEVKALLRRDVSVNAAR